MLKVSALNSDAVEKILKEMGSKQKLKWVEFITGESFTASYMDVKETYYKLNEKLFREGRIYFYEYLEMLGIGGPTFIDAQNNAMKWDIFDNEIFGEAWIHPEFAVKMDDTGEVVFILQPSHDPV